MKIDPGSQSKALSRIYSIDLLRGLVVVLMAIDHVRVYAGVPAGGPDAAVFFTRWITHYCAPGFTFFAGVSIFFHAKQVKNINDLSKFLLIRGLWLVILEVTVIRFLWTFNFDFRDFFLAGVIWMLGWCMVLMALLVRLRPLIVGVIGIAIMALQQAPLFLQEAVPRFFQGSLAAYWNFIYPTGTEGPGGVTILYVIVPWIGVMAAGYGFGLIMDMEPEKRDRLCLVIGLSFVLLFVLIGSISVLRQPMDENNSPFIFRLLNQNKYPPSQLFLLMTLGPLIGLIPYAEKANGKFASVLRVFGSVPMFYYLLHILLIHLTALVVNLALDGTPHQEWYVTAPFWTTQPEGMRWSLPLLYAVFIIDVVILYFLCRWYGWYKRNHPEKKWLKFV